MPLWSRVGLIVLGFVAVIVAGLLVLGQLREAGLQDELARAEAAGSNALWDRIVATKVERLRSHSSIVEQSRLLREAIAEQDLDRIAAIASGVFEALVITGDVDRLDLVGRDGVVLYSSRPAFSPGTAASTSTIRRIVDDGWRGGGIANDSERNVTVSFGVPLRGPAGEVNAAAVYSSNISNALRQLQRDTGVEGLIINRRGRLLAGTSQSVWESLRGQLQLAPGEARTVRAEEQVFNLVAFPLDVQLGTLVATLVIVHDSSAAYATRAFWGRVAIGIIGGFLLISLLGLSLYLHRALAPLSSGVRVLQALAEGDTQVDLTVAGAEGDDEFGRLARAINKFRVQTATLNRHHRTQNLRRQQQERFIRNEMTRLAETLGQEPRREILRDLADIEKQATVDQESGEVGDTDAASRDGLLMTGIAFEKMTDRVAAQQKRLTTVIADLQEALKAKTAFLALQKDLEIAESVQRSFLPGEHFATAGVDIQAIMRTAKVVGGDFYDFFALDDDRVGVVIADVAGKGIPAALFMAVARTLIRATATHLSRAPGECLSLANDMLVDFTSEDNFVTVFYGIFDRRDNSLLYANGGHNPPVLVQADGQTELLPLTKGVALAMFPGLTYQESRAELSPGTKLFMYTDGVPESSDTKGTEFGDERMISNLVADAKRQSAEVIESMLHAVDEFAGEAEQFDDITMMVLSRG